MTAAILALLLPVLGPAPGARPEVRGLLATAVTFRDDAATQLAEAVLDLLGTSSHTRPATEEEWLDARRRCHVRAHFPDGPRPVEPQAGGKLDVDEVIATFPLASTGGLWVRSGDRFAYFAKYSGPSLDTIQALLREARPAE